MRRAVQDFLRDNPSHLPTSALAPRTPVLDTASDSHPYNMGLVWASVGSLDVYMFVDSPGEYWLDFMKHRRASDQQARAAFGPETFARHRAEGAALEQERRIEQAVAGAVAARDAEGLSEEQRRQELRAKAARAVRTVQKQVQAAADKAVTRWLDAEAPTA
jgi:hypothetical protein